MINDKFLANFGIFFFQPNASFMMMVSHECAGDNKIARNNEIISDDDDIFFSLQQIK